MKDNYNYPFNEDWTKEEIIIVMKLWQGVEDAYEQGINVEEFKKVYQQFKGIVQSIGEEKKLGKEFEQLSGYSLYRVTQEVKNASGGFIRMKGAN